MTVAELGVHGGTIGARQEKEGLTGGAGSRQTVPGQVRMWLPVQGRDGVGSGDSRWD